jgi:hypothetical protein
MATSSTPKRSQALAVTPSSRNEFLDDDFEDGEEIMFSQPTAPKQDKRTDQKRENPKKIDTTPVAAKSASSASKTAGSAERVSLAAATVESPASSSISSPPAKPRNLLEMFAAAPRANPSPKVARPLPPKSSPGPVVRHRDSLVVLDSDDDDEHDSFRPPQPEPSVVKPEPVKPKLSTPIRTAIQSPAASRNAEIVQSPKTPTAASKSVAPAVDTSPAASDPLAAARARNLELARRLKEKSSPAAGTPPKATATPWEEDSDIFPTPSPARSPPKIATSAPSTVMPSQSDILDADDIELSSLPSQQQTTKLVKPSVSSPLRASADDIMDADDDDDEFDPAKAFDLVLQVVQSHPSSTVKPPANEETIKNNMDDTDGSGSSNEFKSPTKLAPASQVTPSQKKRFNLALTKK